MAKLITLKDFKDALSKLAKAILAKEKFEVVCKDEKRKADEQYKKSARPHLEVIAEYQESVLDYCIQNRDQIFEAGKKTAIIGPMTIEAKLSPKPVLRTTRGDEVDMASVLEAIEQRIKSTRSDEMRELLEGCVDRKPVLKLEDVKKLPLKTLEDLGLKLVKNEIFSLKPNGEQ